MNERWAAFIRGFYLKKKVIMMMDYEKGNVSQATYHLIQKMIEQVETLNCTVLVKILLYSKCLLN